jgi:hypothetical protein
MKWIAAGWILISLLGCSRSDDVRESVAVPKAAAESSAPVGNAQASAATASEVPNSASPDDGKLGGGIQH